MDPLLEAVKGLAKDFKNERQGMLPYGVQIVDGGYYSPKGEFVGPYYTGSYKDNTYDTPEEAHRAWQELYLTIAETVFSHIKKAFPDFYRESVRDEYYLLYFYPVYEDHLYRRETYI